MDTKAVNAIELTEAAAKHMRDRAATYDKPEGERSMAQTVAVFNLYHGTKLTEAQGWHFQQILKDVRLFTRDAYHADSAEDCVAYAALKAEAKAKEPGKVEALRPRYGDNAPHPPFNVWLPWEPSKDSGAYEMPKLPKNSMVRFKRRDGVVSEPGRGFMMTFLDWRHHFYPMGWEIVEYMLLDPADESSARFAPLTLSEHPNET